MLRRTALASLAAGVATVAARSTMARATRSFMLPVGLADSSFAMMRADPAGTTRRSSTSGVLPMASRTCRGALIALLLWAHSARIPSLRQQPFDEVEALLRLGQLQSQLAHFAFHRVKPILEFAPTAELLLTGTGPQAPRPQPEGHRERHVNRGMLRLRLSDCEPGSGQVDDAQHDGDRVPGRGFEGHRIGWSSESRRSSQP